jgi:hypothetical protein
MLSIALIRNAGSSMMRPCVSAHPLAFFVGVCAFAAVPVLAHADDPCAAFGWDVHHERGLFAQQPRPAVAGQTLGTAPALATDQLYQLRLSAQPAVTFVAPPGGKRHVDSAYAGLATLTVDAAGVYRISLDLPVWIDVFANGTGVAARDFQGRPGCNAPHKIVEFALPAGTPVTLQFSGGNVPTVKITVTRIPAP